jgi:hypothetical protein
MDLSITRHAYADLMQPSDSLDCGLCKRPVDPNEQGACFTHRMTGKEPRSFWAHGDCMANDRKCKGLKPTHA